MASIVIRPSFLTGFLKSSNKAKHLSNGIKTLQQRLCRRRASNDVIYIILLLFANFSSHPVAASIRDTNKRFSINAKLIQISISHHHDTDSHNRNQIYMVALFLKCYCICLEHQVLFYKYHRSVGDILHLVFFTLTAISTPLYVFNVFENYIYMEYKRCGRN